MNNSMAGSTSQGDSPLVPTVEKMEQSESGCTTIRKLNLRVAPFCALITILAYIDRGNLGFAASKICNELELSHKEYGVGASLFFVGYVFSQIPSNILLKKFGAIRWLAFLLIAWGIAASSLAFVQNQTQFYVLRFVLGLAEGGCFPGVWYYVSTFFPSLYSSVPFAFIEVAIQLASPASALVAAGLLAFDGQIAGIAGWRLLFFVEGVVPIIYGAFLPWSLPSSPEKASFLNNEEKTWLEFELKGNQHPALIQIKEQIRIIFKAVDFWRLVIYHFLRFIILNTGLYWTTLIIDDMLNGDEDDDDDDTCASSKSTGAVAVILTTIPFTMCASLCMYIGHIASKLKSRPLTGARLASIGAIFWVAWVVSRHHVFVVALIALGLAISSANMAFILVIGMLTSHFDSETKATAISAFNTIGSCGGILGPIVLGFLIDDYGYGAAVTFLAAVSLVSGALLVHVNDPLHTPIPEDDIPWDIVEA